MANWRVEVITSVERRRCWSAAEKERLVAASLEPGAVASALARETLGSIRASSMDGAASCVRGEERRRILRRSGLRQKRDHRRRPG